MTLIFDPLSSPGATRDLFVDLSGALEPGELLSLVTVTSGYPVALEVSNVAINTAVVQHEGLSFAAGCGVQFTLETLQPSRAKVPLLIAFEGDSGTVDQYEITQPLVTALT